MTRYDLLFQAFTRARQPPPADLAGALQALPPVGQLPSPWETWALVGFVRHRRRQLWLGEVVTTRLSGSLTGIGRMGALGHPQGVPQLGPVPGLAEWEYFFHGKGCRLTHRVTGERIDVDFFSDSAEYFDSWFYTNYLESLRNPEPPEQRLIELHRSFEPLRLAIADLLAGGMLTPLPGRQAHPFRVSAHALEHADAVADFCEAWGDSGRRLWLAALIGDWPAVQDAARSVGDATVIDLVADRARACREACEQRLLGAFREETEARAALLGLDDLDAGSLGGALSQALAGPPSGLTSVALDVLDRRNDPEWCPQVVQLFGRVDPGGPIPQPHLWMACLKFLLRHGHRTEEALAALPSAAGYEMGEACLLALEHAPALMLPLVRRALLSGIPANRTVVAAVLALIDRPWSRRELLAALKASDDQERTADCRAALLECHDEAAHRAVRQWEVRNPHEPETGTFLEIDGRKAGPFISFAEMSLRDRAVRARHEMQRLHDRVMKVRDRVPPEPARGRGLWWRFWRR
jgi:hypothetical protein